MAASKPSSQGHFSITIEIEGPDLKNLTQEAGGHRLQRLPPSEKKGRIHTSTVTVAIIEPILINSIIINEQDVIVEWYSGSGAGGQHRNRKLNSCRLRHIPTGIICTAQTRSRENSKKIAMLELTRRVNEVFVNKDHAIYAMNKKQQVGSGQRGDKIRTIRFQENQALDHRTNKRITATEYMKGYMDLLWPEA